jgi:hypothetical protein
MKKNLKTLFVDTAHMNPCGPVSLTQTTRNARKTDYCRLIRRTSNEQRKFENLLEANLYSAGGSWSSNPGGKTVIVQRPQNRCGRTSCASFVWQIECMTVTSTKSPHRTWRIVPSKWRPLHFPVVAREALGKQRHPGA